MCTDFMKNLNMLYASLYIQQNKDHSNMVVNIQADAYQSVYIKLFKRIKGGREIELGYGKVDEINILFR